MSHVRKLLLAVAVVTGAAIAVRMFTGPVRLIVPIPNPFNLEGIFGAALVLLLLTGRGEERAESPVARMPLLAALVGAVAILAFAGVSNYGFLCDDFLLLAQASHSTWTSIFNAFTTPGGDGYYRPFSDLSIFLDFQWAGWNAALWHWSGIALHALNAVIVLFLARRCGLSSFAAAFAGLLFAAHGVHPEVAAWSPAARFDLLATLFSLAGVALYLRAEGLGVWYWAALLCLLAGVTSKESAYILPLLLLLFAWREGKVRVRPLVPFFAAAALVFVYRLILFHGIGGYTMNGESQALHLRPTSTLKSLASRLWAVLYFPVNWSREPSVWLAILGVLYIAALIWLALRGGGKKLWLPFGLLIIVVLPPLHLLGIGPYLFGSRVVYLASAGFCIFLAAAIESVPQRAVVAAAILAFHTAALWHNLTMWRDATATVAEACTYAAAQATDGTKLETRGMPHYLDGVPSFAIGFPQCVEHAAGHPVDVHFIPEEETSTKPPDPGRRVLVWDASVRKLR